MHVTVAEIFEGKPCHYEELELPFATVPLVCLWLDSPCLPLQRSGISWLVQTN